MDDQPQQNPPVEITRAVVINLTKHTAHLPTHDGDSVSVPPTTGGRSVTIDYKFLQWIPPNTDEIRVLYYIDSTGKRWNQLPDNSPPPPEPAAENNSATAATEAEPVPDTDAAPEATGN